jgi:hypothetical protein
MTCKLSVLIATALLGAAATVHAYNNTLTATNIAELQSLSVPTLIANGYTNPTVFETVSVNEIVKWLNELTGPRQSHQPTCDCKCNEEAEAFFSNWTLLKQKHENAGPEPA